MIRATAIRLAMAMVMALWSPMWCQCVLRAAAAPVGSSPVQVACAGECADGCMNEVAVPIVCCPGESEHQTDGDPCSCDCCDQALTLAALQARAVDLPSHSSVDAIDHFASDLIAISSVAGMPLSNSSGRDGPGHPCPWRKPGLLRLHCLLLV